MAGLNLEALLKLLQADVGAWFSLGAIVLVLGLMAWTSWGSRRALRKCLVLSICVHMGLAYFGGARPIAFLMGERPDRPKAPGEEAPRIRSIQVASLRSDGGLDEPASASDSLTAGGLPRGVEMAPLPLLDASEPVLRADRPDAAPKPVEMDLAALAALDPDAAAPVETAAPVPVPETRADEPAPPEPATSVAQVDPSEVALPELSRPSPVQPGPELARPEAAVRSGRPTTRSASGDSFPQPPDMTPLAPAISPAGDPVGRLVAEPGARETIGIAAAIELPGANPVSQAEADLPTPESEPVARRSAPEMARPEVGPLRGNRPTVNSAARPPAPPPLAPALADLNRRPPTNPGMGLLDLPGPRTPRAMNDVPSVYRLRLDPNRAARARLAGATDASEQAVGRALEWLARHQDADGRWDAGTARYNDGTTAPGDDSFTAHCPPGDLCHGECYYWEADTAVTGLALLAYLGAGCTHQDGGRYAPTIKRGLSFLLAQQAENGDLRGKSRAVGMYCHAMATLALSEAYALSGDPALETPVARAVNFLVRAQYPNLMGWRYSPGNEITRKPGTDGKTEYLPHPPVGDTSVLGWVVLVLKSAHEVGVNVPVAASEAAQNWLKLVSEGQHGGLARYQPSRPVDPTMTAEAWVCRQFLGLAPQGPTSDEAEKYLLDSPPTLDSFNVYYWYYGTLAMYQRGGAGWERWNIQARDYLVQLQQKAGHKSGSWDPDPTRYGNHGGRLYTTALATLTLEVYYRYLRLQETPSAAPLERRFPPPIATPPAGGDGSVRRATGGN